MLDIREQQKFLQRLHYSVTVDGQESPQFTRSVKAFQRDLKLPVSGELSLSDIDVLKTCVRNQSVR